MILHLPSNKDWLFLLHFYLSYLKSSRHYQYRLFFLWYFFTCFFSSIFCFNFNKGQSDLYDLAYCIHNMYRLILGYASCKFSLEWKTYSYASEILRAYSLNLDFHYLNFPFLSLLFYSHFFYISFKSYIVFLFFFFFFSFLFFFFPSLLSSSSCSFSLPNKVFIFIIMRSLNLAIAVTFGWHTYLSFL